MKHFYLYLAALLILCACPTKTIEKDVPPQLQLTVTDKAGVNISQATVQLFDNQTDWENKTAAVQTGTTNADGQVLFQNLNEQVYFFHIEKDERTNTFEVVTHTEALKKNHLKQLTITLN